MAEAGQTFEQERQERREKEQSGGEQDQRIGAASPAGRGEDGAGAIKARAKGGRDRKARGCEQGHGAEAKLQRGEQGRLGQVEIEAQGLKNRKLDGCGARAAAEGERHGKAAEADGEHGEPDAGEQAAQHGPFDMGENGAGRHIEGGCEAQTLGRDGLPALQDHTGGQRHVEKDMRQDNPL